MYFDIVDTKIIGVTKEGPCDETFVLLVYRSYNSRIFYMKYEYHCSIKIISEMKDLS